MINVYVDKQLNVRGENLTVRDISNYLNVDGCKYV
jgi:hypothetical protein